MIKEALTILLKQLNKGLSATSQDPAVVLGNIGHQEGGGSAAGASQSLDRLVLTLVNITEEASLKNGAQERLEGDHWVRENRPVHLHLYLLFSAAHGDYGTALKMLSRVVEFFQANTVFAGKKEDFTSLGPGDQLQEEAAGNFRLVMDLQSLPFEQVNHLWGSLGGKQVPFVLYRGRLVALKGAQTGTEVPRIKTVTRVPLTTLSASDPSD